MMVEMGLTTPRVGTAATEPVAAAPARQQAARLWFVDNVRWSMIVLVLGMHAAVTYSPFGGWYYREHPRVGPLETLFFATFQGVLQGFFMSLLFFVAGYFAAGSYDAKGRAGFLKERLLRLGAPTLLFVFLIGPLTEYFIAPSSGVRPPPGEAIRAYLGGGAFLGATGPLWFCVALLIFCAVYAAIRGNAPPMRAPPVPTAAGVAVTIVLIAAATFAVRLVQPLGAAVLNMQLCYFPAYVVMFALGPMARRGGWLSRVADRFAFKTAAACIGIAMAMWLPLLAFGGALSGRQDQLAGGLHWPSAGLSLWEALVCIGMSFGLLAAFRRWAPGRGRVSGFMSDNGFAVYVIHPPILIGLAVTMAPVHMEPVMKFLVLWILAAAASFGLAAPLARRIPLLGQSLR